LEFITLFFDSKLNFELPAGSLTRQFNEFNYEGSNAASGFEFYGGNDQPSVELKHGFEPKTFSELASAIDKDRKNNYKKDPPWPDLEFKRLAVLRMDVDGLGKILQEGFPSLAHYSALSRSLDWFFKGHLNYIWENDSFEIAIEKGGETSIQRCDFKDWTQILYAGGDDLFLVGRWDCLLDFSFKIKQAFHRYVCENEILGLSGGISLVTHKYPIMKAAEQAGAAESKAKWHNKEIEGKKGEFHFKKNSFNLLGRSLHWQTEFEIVQSLKTRLVEVRRMSQKPMPQSVLMKIAAFHEQRELQKRSGEPPSWKWRIAYDLTRARERAKGNPTVSALIDEIVVSIFTNRSMHESFDEKNARAHEFYDLLMVAIRWAELELRYRRALEKGQKQD
jgi:CRISPR-associated protein Csm1